MDIKSLKARQGNVDVTGTISEKGDVREFNKFGKAGRVANAVLEDSSGKIKLTLWNEQIDALSEGDTVQIKNGFVNEWQGTLQLSTGRMGTITVISKGAGPSKSGEAKSSGGEQDSKVAKPAPKSDSDSDSPGFSVDEEEISEDLDEDPDPDEEEN